MANIDEIAQEIKITVNHNDSFPELEVLLDQYAMAAKHECETMKSDNSIFEIWPQFVASGESLLALQATHTNQCSAHDRDILAKTKSIIDAGAKLINWIARARVPMASSTQNFAANCRQLRRDQRARG